MEVRGGKKETLSTHHDHCTTCDYDTGSVGHLSLAVPGDARVVANVLIANGANPEFGAVVENAHRARGLHRISVLVPQYLWHWRSVRLTV